MATTYGTLRTLNSIPIFIGGMILLLLLKMSFDCIGQTVIVTPQAIQLGRGGKSKEILWSAVRGTRYRKFRPFYFTLYTSFVIRDSDNASLEIHDIAFPDLQLIAEIVKTALASLKDKEYKI